MILDQTGSLANMKRHDYLPFGEELFAPVSGRSAAQGYSGGDAVRQQFTLKERDSETGLDYFLARYYSSTTGRFTSADSIGGTRLDPQSLNLYSYVLNNPLVLIDPDGHASELPCNFGGTGPCIGTFQDPNTSNVPPAKKPGDPFPVASCLGCGNPMARVAIIDVPHTFTDNTSITTNEPVLATSVDLKPVLRATAGGGDLELALPDYYQLEINIAIPNKFTLTAVGISLTGTLDRNGNFYGGIGPSLGKSLTGFAVAGTANYVIDGMTRTVRNEDQLASFLSGHSITGGGGFITGGHGTWVPGNGFGLGT
jgi:RHS repeat-associated protein